MKTNERKSFYKKTIQIHRLYSSGNCGVLSVALFGTDRGQDTIDCNPTA
jgi:hypothetical protein